jgi:DNA-binding NarL/FixJ family response regulator
LDLAGVRVLVVEDEALIALDVGSMLEALGAEVCGTAASGADAVRQARRLRPQLGVVDIHLKDGEPGVDAARVMTDEVGVAIVFATAHSDPGLQARMADVAGAARVFKPYGADDLLDAARQALQRSLHKAGRS